MSSGMNFWAAGHGPGSLDAAQSAARAGSAADQAARSVKDLQEQVDKLTLISMAMWSMLQDVTKFTEKDLLQRVRDLDLMDGEPDGKITRKVARCPKCDRVMSPRHKRCLYCGHEKLKTSAFDDVT